MAYLHLAARRCRAARRLPRLPAHVAPAARLPPGADARRLATVARRAELIAAYVSALNACDYCAGVHQAVAAAFGIDAATIATVLGDVDTAPVAEPMKAILRYVGKLTSNPSRVTSADAAEVFAAGWNETALHDAVSVCALFNLMNRLVDGLGVTADQAYFDPAVRRLANIDYSGLKDLL